MAEPAVIHEVEAEGTLTLSRPKVLNALSQELVTGLRATLSLAKSNSAVRAVLLIGAGADFARVQT